MIVDPRKENVTLIRGVDVYERGFVELATGLESGSVGADPLQMDRSVPRTRRTESVERIGTRDPVIVPSSVNERTLCYVRDIVRQTAGRIEVVIVVIVDVAVLITVLD